MNKILLILTLLPVAVASVSAQEDGYVIPQHILPKFSTEAELMHLQRYGFSPASMGRGIENPPPFGNLRAMAEWEEIQALTIAWTSYPGILKQIVNAAREETQIIILAEDPQAVESYLLGSQGGFALPDLTNVQIVEADYNSVWMRDYAGNTVYGSEVDDLLMVDWIYNRPNRPDDDASPQVIADHLGLDLYCLTEAPADLVNTGGNFMVDGFGTAFASELILEENEQGNPYGVTTKSETQIDNLMSDYLGLDNYIKMITLPFDAIHHIDMHMKLLDEETLLVGQFPEGESDGPQLEANIEFVLDQTTTKWGTPWRIKWIPMVPNTAGNFPDGGGSSPYYRTFTNSVFVNKTIIIPTYREEFDTTALRLYEELLPGYNLVPIDCDNQPEVIIAASGAIHCITHAVGVADPLLISHLPLKDTDDNLNPYTVEAYIKHRTGIASAALFYKLAVEDDYVIVDMIASGGDNWMAQIPAQPFGSTVYYYVEGTSESGKVQVRPITAPQGYWKFRVMSELVGLAENVNSSFALIYPNPASAITVVPLTMRNADSGIIHITDVLGKVVMEIHNGAIPKGESKYFFDASELSAGAYLVSMETRKSRIVQKLLVK